MSKAKVITAMIKDKTRLMEMCEMAEEGMSFQEIGDRYGITRERVRQFISEAYPVQGRPIKNCIFPGLLCWMVNNWESMKLMCQNLGIMSYQALVNKMRGKTDFTLSEIKAILAYTGLTFDEAFGEVKRPE